MSKSIEELEKQVADLQMGLVSADDLQALFGDIPAVEPPIEQPTPAVATPPAPTAPVQVTPTVPTPAPQPTVAQPAQTQPAQLVVEQPAVLESLPEKFKDKDVQGALMKAVKSYSDLESEYKRQQDELAKLQKIVTQIVVQQPSSVPVSTPAARTPQITQPTAPMIDLTEIIPDSEYFEHSDEAVRKASRQEAYKIANDLLVHRILEYHDWLTKQLALRDFRKDHTDFDDVKDDMVAIAQIRPDIDRLPPEQSLPILYGLAKERQKIKFEAMRKSLGIAEQTGSREIPTTPAIQPLIDPEKLKAEIMAKLIEEIKKRRAAAGIQGSETVPPVQPQARGTPTVAEKPKTYEEEVFDRMLTAGPKHPDEVFGIAK